MPKAKTELKVECIRLRVEERLSYREIQERTGASKGSLSGWLKGYPLTQEERRECLVRAHPGAWNKGRKKERGQESTLFRTVNGNSLNSNQRAKVAEAAVLLRLLAHGFTPFGSVFDGDKTDWLVEIPKTGKVLKIQVKLARHLHTGLPTTSVRSSSQKKKYTQRECDFLVGFDLFTDTAYVWAWAELEDHTTSVTICEEAAENWSKLFG